MAFYAQSTDDVAHDDAAHDYAAHNDDDVNDVVVDDEVDDDAAIVILCLSRWGKNNVRRACFGENLPLLVTTQEQPKQQRVVPVAKDSIKK